MDGWRRKVGGGTMMIVVGGSQPWLVDVLQKPEPEGTHQQAEEGSIGEKRE
jgi:hypothetical protein